MWNLLHVTISPFWPLEFDIESYIFGNLWTPDL